MEQYISKSAVVAEIERRISLFQKEKKTEKWSAEASQINVVSLGARIAMLEEILSFLNTLETKDVNEIIKTAEDHAYFAGSENTREKLIEKACKWLKTYRQDTPDGTGYIAGIVNDKTIEDFRKAMEE